jgi:hypothetical protein|tara:strand:- start:1809 stop:2057 length:249 start_codon:yes stop_codon:yes gene_type:complete
MKNRLTELQDFIDNQKESVKKKVREKAISRTESNLIYNGRSVDEISDEDLEHLIADEEDKIWQTMKTSGIAAVAAIFGIAWF